ncbi:hypothetical protein D3C80_2123780 [compost metagenome]
MVVDVEPRRILGGAFGNPAVMDLLAVNDHATRRLNPQADLATVYLGYSDPDVAADDDGLSDVAAEHEHV